MAKTVVEEFVAVLGWDVDPKGLEKFSNQANELKSIVGKAALAIAGAVTAVTALVTITNKQTAVNTNLARSFGISAEAAENWGFLLSAIGLEVSAVTRLMKDMSVRIGQAAAGIGSAETIKDAAKAINLEFDKLQKMKPEEQYIAILQAAKDSTDQATALAAAQQLGGRQAAQIVAYLRTQNGTVEEILANQARINVQTEEGRAGALRFFYALDDVGNAVSSIQALFSGLVGEGIAPFMELFNEWVRSNRDLIRIEIKKWAEGFIKVVKVLGGVLFWIWERVKAIIDLLGGFNKALRLTAFLFASLISLKALGALSSFVALIRSAGIAQGLLAAKTAATKLAMAGLRAVGVGLFALLLEDLYQFLAGGESLIGQLGEKFGPKVGEFLDNTSRMFASWFGITGKKYDLFVQKQLDFLDSIPGFFSKAFDLAGRVVNSFFSFWGNQITQFKDILVSIYDAIVSATQFAIDKVKSGINIIRGLIPNFVVNAIGGATPQPSPGAINNNSGGNVAVNNQNNINVTQQPGQSATDLAKQIARQIGEQSANAVRNNTSGVVY